MFLWDEEVKGFGLKVTPTGARSYVYQYRMGGREAKVRRFTIGQHGQWTPDGARKEAKRLAQLVDQGQDPALLNTVRRREAIELAFSSYAERFIVEYLQIEWKGGHELASGILRRSAIPFLKQKSIREISRADISALMDKLAGKPATRRNAFAVLRRLFKWAVNRGDLDVSPIRDMDAPSAPASRDRVLADEELARVWHAAGQAGYPFGIFTRLLVLSGQRREEVSALNWSELDRENALWILPAVRAKNRVVHEVPLCAEAVALLDEVAELKHFIGGATKWPKAGFVFTISGKTPVTGYSAAKRRLDKLILSSMPIHNLSSDASSESGLAPWRFHDLRRTLATGLQRLGVRFEVTEAVLNHVSGSKSGVAGVYQRYHWSNEKRAALDAWGAHVRTIVMHQLGE